MQTKKHSAIEAAVNVFIGYVVAILSQMMIFPLFGIATSTSQNFQIAAWFTVVSILRSYCLRRIFNQIAVFYYRSKNEL
jgi:hypothetical protein